MRNSENMKSDPSLTAVIPFFGKPKLHQQIVSSVQKAIELGIRVVVVCDKDDATWKSLVTESNKIKIVNINVHDPGSARNIGLAETETDWICFWDADDQPIPERFIQMVAKTKASQRKIGAGAFNIVRARDDQELKTIQSKSSKEFENDFLAYPGIWRFIFFRELLRHTDFPAISMSEDQIFLGKVINDLSSVFVSDLVVYNYRIGGNQLTKSVLSRKQIRIALDLMVELGFDRKKEALTIQNKVFLKNSATALKVYKSLPIRVVLKLLNLIVSHPFSSYTTLRETLKVTRRIHA